MIRSCLLIAVLAHMLAAQTKLVTVIVRPEPSARDSGLNVFIAGNSPQTGNWNPAAVPLTDGGEGEWRITVQADSGSVMQFKVTAGSWASEAYYDSGSTPRNTIIDVTKDTSVILRPLFWKRYILPKRPESAIRGAVQYHRQLTGPGLNHARDIIVWLPPSYDKNPKKHYPVLYMHDGQNVFDPATAYTGYDWRVDEVADSLMKMKKMEEIIIVGINNSPDRLPEYSDSPLGTAYRNFVITVVKTLVDSTYRTKPGKEHTGVIGSSLGGLSSLLFVWKHPDVFGMAGCLSSSFWYDDERTLHEVKDFEGHKKSIRIYLDCGGREKELLSGYKRMVEILKSKGFKKGKDLEYTLDSKGTHSEYYWAKRVWRPLMFMYGKK